MDVELAQPAGTALHTRKRDLMSAALRQIEGEVVSLPALPEGPSVIDPDSMTPVEVFGAAPAALP